MLQMIKTDCCVFLFLQSSIRKILFTGEWAFYMIQGILDWHEKAQQIVMYYLDIFNDASLLHVSVLAMSLQSEVLQSEAVGCIGKYYETYILNY